MKQYTVTGMSCAACSARVEKTVSKVDGVTSCSVSLLTNSMGVEGSATDAQIVEAVGQAGYGASPKGTATESENDKANNSLEQLKAAQDALVDRETPKLVNRLIASLIFLVVLMYFSMGHMMWGWPLPEFFNGNHVAMGLLQLLLTVAVMVINQKFFISGFKGLIHGRSQHGYACCAWLCGIVWIQRVCTFCHDSCAGEWRYGCGHVIYA